MSSALLGFLPDAGKLSAPIDGDHEAKRVCNDFWSGVSVAIVATIAICG
jgi:hypothetical protein